MSALLAQVLTEDAVEITIETVIHYRVEDPILAVTSIDDADHSTRHVCAAILRSALSKASLSHIIAEREAIRAQVSSTVTVQVRLCWKIIC